MTTMAGNTKLPDDVYPPAVEPERLPQTLEALRSRFWDRISSSGLLALWRRSHHTWYGTDGNGNWANSVAVTYGGDGGQIVLARVNHYRSIGQALVAQATGMRPAFEARSVNTDVQSLREAPLATGIVDYEYREKKLEDLVTRETDAAVRYGEAHHHMRWDPFAGRVHVMEMRPVYESDGVPKTEETLSLEGAPRLDEMGQPVLDETGSPIVDVVEQWVSQPVMENVPKREGDIAPLLLSPHEVVRDLDTQNSRWAMFPYRENAWELAARYPDKREAILKLRGGDSWPRTIFGSSPYEKCSDGDDELVVWVFYHLDCDALPGGRYAHVVGDIVLHDEPWPLEKIPFVSQMPMRHDNRNVGYTPMADLLCLQEVHDACFSALATAFDAGSVGTLVSQKGTDVSVEQLARALQLIEYDPIPGAPGGGKPEVLDLFKLREDHFKLLDVTQRIMETLSGIGSVVRGDPNPQLKSGAALALAQSLTAFSSSGIQRENANAHQETGTWVLRLYKKFSETERVAEITGRSNRTALVGWKAEQIRSVDRVTIELGNPMMRQRAGIMQIAEMMLEHELFEDRDEFLVFLDSGRLEPTYNRQKRRALQIEDENEALMDGKPVEALWADDHPMHMERHLCLLDDPMARQDAGLVKRVQDHVEKHKMLWMGMDPAIAVAMGVAPPPMPVGPPMLPPGGKPPPGGGAPALSPGSDLPAEGRAVPAGAPPGTGGPDMPFMPTNPITGERAPATPTNPS